MSAGRTVIIGGGFGGLEAAFSLREASRDCEIILIDRSPWHAFIPSIHEIISGKVGPDDIRIPLEPLLGRFGIRFVLDEVVDLDTARRRVVCRSGEFHFDYAVISCGAAAGINTPGAERFAVQFRTPEDAAALRKTLMGKISEAVFPFSIAVAGAGTEGPEVAGEIIDLLRHEGLDDYLESGEVRMHLIERKTELLSGVSSRAGRFAQGYLSRRGVRITTGHSISNIDQDGIILDSGERIRTDLVIWTAGIRPAGLIRKLPLAKDPEGWLVVTERLFSPDNERIYAVGDAISIHDGKRIIPVPRLAYHAADQGRTAGRNIYFHMKGQPAQKYRSHLRPQLISLGKKMGIMADNKTFRSGAWVITLKKTIEKRHLFSCLNRGLLLPVLPKIYGFGFLRKLL